MHEKMGSKPCFLCMVLSADIKRIVWCNYRKMKRIWKERLEVGRIKEENTKGTLGQIEEKPENVLKSLAIAPWHNLFEKMSSRHDILPAEVYAIFILE